MGLSKRLKWRIPRVVTKLNEQVLANKNVIKVHAGDALTGDLFLEVEAQAEADSMQEACFDVFTIGNHNGQGR